MIDLIFSAESTPGITGIFWLQDIRNVDTPDLRKSLFDRLVNSDRSLGSIFKAIIEAVTEFAGYNRCCAKFPVYINHIPDLLEWYPQCRIIHITRDPRAIALSRTNDPGGTRKKAEKFYYLSRVIKKQMIAFVILQYVWTARVHVSFKKSRNYILLNYENLLADPESTIKRLFEFLQLDYMYEILIPKNGEYAQHSSITGKQITEFDPEAAYRWKKVIGRFDEKMVKLFARSGMKKLGYRMQSLE